MQAQLPLGFNEGNQDLQNAGAWLEEGTGIRRDHNFSCLVSWHKIDSPQSQRKGYVSRTMDDLKDMFLRLHARWSFKTAKIAKKWP